VFSFQSSISILYVNDRLWMRTAKGRQIQEDGDGELKLVKKQTFNGRERERGGKRER
jgi:hypothetical protein